MPVDRVAARWISLRIITAYPTMHTGLTAVFQLAPDISVDDNWANPGTELLPTIRIALVDSQSGSTAGMVAVDLADADGLVALTDSAESWARLGSDLEIPWAALPRDSQPDAVVAATRAVAAGLIVLHPQFSQAWTQAVPMVRPPDAGLLTSRELQVLQLMSDGLANKNIAARLGITEHTAKYHVAAILMRLSVASRTEAVSTGIRLGLVSL